MNDFSSVEQAKKDIWKLLEKVTAFGFQPNRVFNDWLDCMLNSYLSLTEKLKKHGLSVISKPELLNEPGKYNDRYMEIIKGYPNDKYAHGKRPIDYFAKAFSLIQHYTKYTGDDILGDIYMENIASKHSDAYFTPMPITKLMSALTVGENVSGKKIHDPACGSGRMFIAAAEKNPENHFYGTDVNYDCVRMAALNMYFLDLRANIYQGDSLGLTFYKEYLIRKGGWLIETIYDPPLDLAKFLPEKSKSESSPENKPVKKPKSKAELRRIAKEAQLSFFGMNDNDIK